MPGCPQLLLLVVVVDVEVVVVAVVVVEEFSFHEYLGNTICILHI